jgi:hypothetical protein
VRYGSAAGNSTRGIFALGLTPVPSSRDKYTYACDTNGAAASASAAGSSSEGSAASNGTCGVNI